MPETPGFNPEAELAALTDLHGQLAAAIERGKVSGDFTNAETLEAALETRLQALEARSWPLAELEKAVVTKEYREQLAVLQKLSDAKGNPLIEQLPSGELGIVGIDGKPYPIPSLETVLSVLKERRALLIQKISQGFVELELVPVGLPLRRLAEAQIRLIGDHYVDMPNPSNAKERIPDPDKTRLFAPSADPNATPVPLTVDTQQPLYVWDGYAEKKTNQGKVTDPSWADERGELFYLDLSRPGAFTLNKDDYYTADGQLKPIDQRPGLTKVELLAQPSKTPGWQVNLVERQVLLPREGTAVTLPAHTPDGRRQLEANLTSKDYLAAFQAKVTENLHQRFGIDSNQPGGDIRLIARLADYAGEVGGTFESAITRFNRNLEQRNTVTGDVQGKDCAEFCTGSFFATPSDRCVPYFSWLRDYARAYLGRDVPDSRDPNRAVRPRVGAS